MASLIMRSLLEARTKSASAKELVQEARKYFLISGSTSVDENGRLNVNGDVTTRNGVKLERLPVEFGTVSGDFRCGNLGLTSLHGSPHTVGGAFSARTNNFPTLEGGPIQVAGVYNVGDGELQSLLGGPQHCGGAFRVEHNSKLSSLQGAPQHVTDFICYACNLTSLAGGPITVKGHFSCWRNKLTTLEGAPTHVGGDFSCATNELTTLKGVSPAIGGQLLLINNKLTSLEGLPPCKAVSVSVLPNLPLLRVLTAPRCEVFGPTTSGYKNDELTTIMNKYCSADQSTLRKRIVACQKELIDAGYASNAKW
jgi:hypothetical protein